MSPVNAAVAVPPVVGLQLSAPELQAMVLAILQALGLDEVTLDVRLTDDAEVAGLNLAFRDMPGPTNVLSFPNEDGGEDEAMDLGQVVVSRDQLLREARLYGQDPLAHLARLLAHGILHLAGEDHGPAMEARTDAAVQAVCPE